MNDTARNIRPSFVGLPATMTATTVAGVMAWQAIAGLSGTTGTTGVLGYLGDGSRFSHTVRAAELANANFDAVDAMVRQPHGTPRWTEPALLLRAALHQFFAGATLTLEPYVDAEEGWTRDVIRVTTGVADLDARMAAEDRFFESVNVEPRLLAALGSVIVSFR